MRARKSLTFGAAIAAVATMFVAGLGTPASAVAPSLPPTLTSPGDGVSVATNPVLTWTAVDGAAKYHVQVAADPGFASPVYDQRTIDTVATPDRDLPPGTLYWRVAASDLANADGPFSDTSTFTKGPGAAPTLVSPADNAVVHYPDDPAVFSWNPVPGVNSYKLQIDDASDFINPTTYTTANTSFTLPEPQTVGQPFFWRVIATSTENVDSLPSDPRQFTEAWLSKPTQLTPANTVLTSVANVRFTWQPVQGAAGYELQVSPNGDWANNVTIDTKSPNYVKGTAYAPPITLDNGSYFWRVRAIDSASTPNFGEWSDEWQFTRGWVSPDPSTSQEKPTLLTPAWNPAAPATIPHVSGALDLSWSPIHHASHYEIQISTDINFSPPWPATQHCYTNHTSYSVYIRKPTVNDPDVCEIKGDHLQTGVPYYWHVRAVDDPQKALSNWSNTGNSDTYRFIIDPTMTTQTGPADGAAVESPNLRWTTVAGADHYDVWIVKANNNVVPGAPFATYATSYTPEKLTPGDGPFRWYVAAVDGNGNLSAVPATQNQPTFTLISPTTLGTLTLTGPADGSSSVRMPAMSWTAVPGAAKYVVHYASNGFEHPPLTTTQTFTTYTSPDLTLAPDTYTWWVESQGATGGTISISTPSTFVISSVGTLGSSDYLTPAKCQLPANCTPVTDTPRLSWTGVPNASWYVVTIANDANFTNVVRTYATAYTTLTPRDSLVDNQAGQAFYWFVQPCLDSGGITHEPVQCGPGATDDTANNNASAFQKRSKAIVLQSPADGSTQPNLISFNWTDFLDTNGVGAPTATQEAQQYQIDVSTVQDFATILDSAIVDNPSYTPYGKTYPEGPLYWRVQAIDGSGNHLTWSATRIVTKSSPPVVLASPGNNATLGGVPAFSWVGQNYAAKYAVEVYKNADLNFSPANKVSTASTTSAKFSAWAPTAGLPSGDYSWRVRAIDAGGQPGQWSVGRVFTVAAASPNLLSPANGALRTQGDLLFSWSVPSDGRAVKYTWQLSSSSGFSTLKSSKTTVMPAWAPTLTITDGTYFWRVQVLDASGNVIATSATRSVTIDSAGPTVVSKSPTGTAPLTGPFEVTFSEPVQDVSGSTFTVVVAGTSTTIPGTVTSGGATAAFHPTGALVPGQKYTAMLTSGITDGIGNQLAPYNWTVRAESTVETSSSVVHETWDRDSASGASGGSYDASAAAGSAAKFKFTGTNVAVVGARASNGGYADVYLDGVKKASDVSFYNRAAQWKRTVWSTSGLSNSSHTIEVRVRGTHPRAASGSWVRVDAFKVGATTYQESSSSVTESFRRVKSTAASGHSYDTVTHVKAGDNGGRPTYSLTFVGTGVTVYGLRGPSAGSAAIYVDGVLRSTVSMHSATKVIDYPIYLTSSLSAGRHTVRVEVVGSRTGRSSAVALDYMLVF